MFERTRKSTPDYANDPAPREASPAPAPQTFEPAPAPKPAAAAPQPARRAAAIIGPTIQIEGHLRGQEDLFVEGEVNGTIHLENHSLTIGSQGKLKADVYAHTIFVDGSMEGDLFGSEQVTIRKSAKVRGNITSPRVSLEDGASFKGSIEMDPDSVKVALGPASAARGAQPAASRPAAANGAGSAFTPASAGETAAKSGQAR